MAYTKNHIMHIIAIAIAIIVLIAAVAGLLAIGKQKRLKAKAQECAKEVQQFQDKLQKLTDPSHFFTDEELLQFKRECAPLLDSDSGISSANGSSSTTYSPRTTRNTNNNEKDSPLMEDSWHQRIKVHGLQWPERKKYLKKSS